MRTAHIRTALTLIFNAVPVIAGIINVWQSARLAGM
jgi:hypothetical protein